MFGTALHAVCCALYLAGGGRWTLVLAFSALAWAAGQKKTDKKAPSAPKEVPPKKSPVYAVDFTTGPGGAQSAQSTPRSIPRPLPRKRTPKVFRGSRPAAPQTSNADSALTQSVTLSDTTVHIFYTSLTGTSLRVATRLQQALAAQKQPASPKLVSLDDDVDDLEEYFLRCPQNSLYVVVLPSYETDSPIDYFLDHLRETYNDFRVDKYPLQKLVGFAVLGLGDLESWKEKFCYQAVQADRWLAKLGGRRVFPVGKVCVKHEGESGAGRWIDQFAGMMEDPEPFYLDPEVDDSDREESGRELDDADTLVDVEDMGEYLGNGENGGTKTARPTKSGKTVATNSGQFDAAAPKQMVAKDSPTYKSLTKQGYTIVGSHSGVKICRWTKSALRGRGSCYKYAFYGIRSHLCMETTPSLACSNKCVFCWRHGTNPVAKLAWRWELDPPETVFAGALEGHYRKIKQLRGVPGVQMERFEEAFTVRHCALSLVGEPIFYPHINELVGMLHARHISSFLVCNAQHPDQLAALGKVTQLYVSIDAPTRTDLKKVDRPLNGDFWERLMRCLDILRTSQAHQRTVFRLTLVKGFNMGDVAAYADLVERARPSQIEIKGATFCGSSNSNGNPLTMQNIPFYEECKAFVEGLQTELQARGLDYRIAAEHAHSCCILMAHSKFLVDGAWHTHIDYPRFFELLELGRDFVDLDYVKPTPEWALYGSDEGGFNPEDTRFDRKADKLRKRLAREEMEF